MAALLAGSLLLVLLAFVAVRARRPGRLSGGAVALVDCVGMLCSCVALSGMLAWSAAGFS